MDETLLNINPVYFFHKEAMPEIVRNENELSSFEVCMSIANIIDESLIEGPQKVGGLWKIYLCDPEARAVLLSNGLSIRHRSINLYDENPYSMKRRYEGQTEKVTIQDLPLSIDNEDVYNLISSYPGCKIIGDVKYSRAKNPAGGWSNFKNGDGFCYLKAPIATPLPKIGHIGPLKCRLYHRTQKSHEKRCKVCRSEGHKEQTSECPMFEPHYAETTVAFRSPSVLSNFYRCDIQYQGKNYPSVEHGYQHTKAKTLGFNDTAVKILNASTARDAKIISKDIPDDEAWDIVKVDVMTDLLKIKLDSCPEFKEAIIQTGDSVLAEATGDLFWASGLSPDLTICTWPSNYPGRNELGKLMMELRSLVFMAEDFGNAKSPGIFDVSVFTNMEQESTDYNKARAKSHELARSPSLADVDGSKDSPATITTEVSFRGNNEKANSAQDSTSNHPGIIQSREHRELRKVVKSVRSSSVPGRKPQRDSESQETRQVDIQKWLGLKRQASSSPEKEGNNKQKSAKTQS